MSVEVNVVRARCIAAKACINAAGGAFAIVDGASMLIDADAATLEELQEAADACPTGAIRVTIT
ncbi:MAG: ferredoxin [Acidimicrobiales bacterium]